MKNRREIDPEIRGLLEEIVADPRSAIRFAPRRALREWFDSGETVRASDVAGTKAERHLIEAYREEVAELLLRAAEIAYWRAPVFFHRPLDDSGQLLDLSTPDAVWQHRSKQALAARIELEGVALLQASFESIPGDQALALAQASLALAPNDKARAFVATSVPWSKPRFSLLLVERQLVNVPPLWRSTLLRHRASRLCALGLLGEARDAYQESSDAAPQSPIGLCYSFSLSCFLGDPNTARQEALELAKRASPSDIHISEAHDILKTWARSQASIQREEAKRVVERVSDSLPDVARPLYQAILS